MLNLISISKLARDGKCAGGAVRASVRSREAGYVRDLYAEVLGNSEHDGYVSDTTVCVCEAGAESDRADGGD